MRTGVLWTTVDALTRGVPQSCAGAALAAIVLHGDDGRLVLVDQRHGQVLDQHEIEGGPVGLAIRDDHLFVTTDGALHVYGLLDPNSADINRSTPSGLKLLWERPVPEYYETFVSGPVVLGSHVVVAMQRTGAVGLAAFDLETHDDDWESDADKSLSGTFGFLTAVDGDRVILGARTGSLRGFTLPSGIAWLDRTLPGGLSEVERLPAPVQGGRLLVVDREGGLVEIPLASPDPARPLGQIRVELAASVGVSSLEIALGTLDGKIMRYNRSGLDHRRFEGHPGRTGSLPGFEVPPVLFESGRLLAVNRDGAIHFFGPRGVGSAPAVKHFSFPSASALTAFLNLGPLLVGVSERGEVQALKLGQEEAG